MSPINYKRFPLGSLLTNGYLFWDDSNDAFFVDPGGESHEVFDYLQQYHLTLKAVLLTHGHLDHIAGIEEFIPFVGNEIYIASEDALLLVRPPEEFQIALGMKCNGIRDSKTIKNGDVLSIGFSKIEAIATSGHTPGSMCYLVTQGSEQLLISGDTLFALSVGRTDLPGGDMELLEASLRKLALLPDDLRVFPGHGPNTTIGTERKNNPYWPESISDCR